MGFLRSKDYGLIFLISSHHFDYNFLPIFLFMLTTIRIIYLG